MYTTIGTLFEQTVQKYPNKEALYYVQKDVRYSYKEWDQQINRLANASGQIQKFLRRKELGEL